MRKVDKKARDEYQISSNLLPQSQLRGAELFLLTVAFMVIITLYLHQPECQAFLKGQGIGDFRRQRGRGEETSVIQMFDCHTVR